MAEIVFAGKTHVEQRASPPVEQMLRRVTSRTRTASLHTGRWGAGSWGAGQSSVTY